LQHLGEPKISFHNFCINIKEFQVVLITPNFLTVLGMVEKVDAMENNRNKDQRKIMMKRKAKSNDVLQGLGNRDKLPWLFYNTISRERNFCLIYFTYENIMITLCWLNTVY
jgi:hypothetical protein